MTKNITLIQCEKCGSTEVIDKEAEDITVLTMEAYIKEHKSRHTMYGALMSGVSRNEEHILYCLTCGFRKPFIQVVYT